MGETSETPRRNRGSGFEPRGISSNHHALTRYRGHQCLCLKPRPTKAILGNHCRLGSTTRRRHACTSAGKDQYVLHTESCGGGIYRCAFKPASQCSHFFSTSLGTEHWCTWFCLSGDTSPPDMSPGLPPEVDFDSILVPVLLWLTPRTLPPSVSQ